MSIEIIIAAISIFISLCTLIFGAIGLRHKAKQSYVDLLEKRVNELEKKLELCREECRRLRDENIELLRKLVHADSQG